LEKKIGGMAPDMSHYTATGEQVKSWSKDVYETKVKTEQQLERIRNMFEKALQDGCTESDWAALQNAIK
jgi:hypothetical protein